VLKVGLLSSWNTRCGIAEYTRNLVTALRRRDDVHVTVFGSKNHGDRAVAEYADDEVPVVSVQIWDPEMRSDLDVERVLEADLDVLHIQYSEPFYNRRRLVELMRRFEGATVVTYHDKAIGHVFPYKLADVLFAHRPDVGVGPRRLIPQGVDIRPPVVKSFGLGGKATEAPKIEEICRRNGWRFETTWGRTTWLSSDELRAWVRDSDAIVLWYPDVPTSGGSSTAPLAMGARRPTFVNDTQAFADLPERTRYLRKVSTLEELEAALREELTDEYASSRSWDEVARVTVDAYREALDARERRRHRAPLRAVAYVAADPKARRQRKHKVKGAA
jgi:hypothetical protein